AAVAVERRTLCSVLGLLAARVAGGGRSGGDGDAREEPASVQSLLEASNEVGQEWYGRLRHGRPAPDRGETARTPGAGARAIPSGVRRDEHAQCVGADADIERAMERNDVAVERGTDAVVCGAQRERVCVEHLDRAVARVASAGEDAPGGAGAECEQGSARVRAQERDLQVGRPAFGR